jgi:hypothetical protein
MLPYRDDLNLTRPIDLSETEARGKGILMDKLKSPIVERYAILGTGRVISDRELNVCISQ